MPGFRWSRGDPMSRKSHGKPAACALVRLLCPLLHCDKIDDIVQVHADGQAAVVARPMARKDLDVSAAPSDDPDETCRFRGVHQIADVGSGHAEPVRNLHVRDFRGQIARVECCLQERVLDQGARSVSKEQHVVGKGHHEASGGGRERQTRAAMKRMKGAVSRQHRAVVVIGIELGERHVMSSKPFGVMRAKLVGGGQQAHAPIARGPALLDKFDLAEPRQQVIDPLLRARHDEARAAASYLDLMDRNAVPPV